MGNGEEPATKQLIVGWEALVEMDNVAVCEPVLSVHTNIQQQKPLPERLPPQLYERSIENITKEPHREEV